MTSRSTSESAVGLPEAPEPNRITLCGENSRTMCATVSWIRSISISGRSPTVTGMPAEQAYQPRKCAGTMAHPWGKMYLLARLIRSEQPAAAVLSRRTAARRGPARSARILACAQPPEDGQRRLQSLPCWPHLPLVDVHLTVDV